MLPISTRARIAVVVGALLVALAVASQIALPRLAERGVEDRLTEGGGVATVSVSAWPAVRLLFDDGARFEVRGSGLDLDVPEERIGILSKLDRKSDV